MQNCLLVQKCLRAKLSSCNFVPTCNLDNYSNYNVYGSEVTTFLNFVSSLKLFKTIELFYNNWCNCLLEIMNAKFVIDLFL